jgi:putative FmdB family regulatory protein
MPLYEYLCKECDKEQWETVHKVECRKTERCPDCGGESVIQMSLQQRPQIYDYYSENLGAQITSPKHRRRLMKANNLEDA